MDVTCSICGCDAGERGMDPQFHRLAESIPQLVWTARGDGACDYVNGRFREYTGLTAEQVGAGLTAVLHPDDADRHAAAWRAALEAGAAFELEVRLRRHDGVYRWFLGRAEPIRDGGGQTVRWLGTTTDIDDRKRAEEGARWLGEDVQRWKNALLEQVSEAAFAWEFGGGIVYFSTSAQRLYGFSEQEALGRRSHELLSTVFPEPLAEVRATLERDGCWEGELLHTARDGRTLAIESRMQLVEGVEPRRLVLQTARDVTVRKRTEESLRQSEERFRRAVMATPFPIMIHADDGEVISVNHAWTELSGYTRDEIPTIAAWLDRAHGAQRDAVRPGVESLFALEGASSETEHAVTTARGELRTWLFRAAPLGKDASGRRLVISIAHDITERKRVDDALRESEANFRQLADAMPQIVWTARPDGAVDYYNRRWYELAGAKEGETTGDGWLAFLHEDDLQRAADAWRRSVATGEPYESEHRFGFPAARGHRWYLCRALPVRGPSGQIVRWYGTCTDIHDQKCAEATLKEADQRKDEFLAMLAHELRNPLGPICNAVEILQLLGAQQPSLTRACGVIERQVSHMARLVDDLLDVSRVARGRIQLRKERCDLAQLVRQTAEDYRSTLEASGIGLEVALPDEPLWVHGDPTRLSQVISNVLHNANKFTDAGGRVAVSLSATPEGSAVIRVRDTGIGMDPAMLTRVFEPFSQADRSLERSRGGLGLGLSLVKGLVELHGGAVSAESAGVGHGTEVRLHLPLTRGIEPSTGRPAAPACPRERSLRILIIEDNEDAAESLQALLTMHGYRVQVALSGAAGVEAACSFRPEVILCDIGLPGGMDGYGVARALKGNLGLSPSLMIALTGYGQEEDQRRVREAGFDMHFIKPIDPRSLQKLLASFTTRA
ncbi:PAS domain S-box protein [Sorangium sp. So ce1036]|uniref:PAS domain-containing hybrid sensor histidine kinase/response regulator n=1 Tax=Sorangium sp. So ce1036 TaxID=3133328 RepID=UPI003F056137